MSDNKSDKLAPFNVLVHRLASPTPFSCAYEQGNPKSQNALVFIGGLGDGPHTVSYARAIAAKLQSEEELSYSLFELRMASSFGGYGYGSLKQDVGDISALIHHLRGLGRNKVVLLGHSTGCQDCVEYADYQKYQSAPVDAYILQAPVSDREGIIKTISQSDLDEGLALAARMLASGRGQEAMPTANLPSFVQTPMTAYRYHSLFAVGGDDDYFSSDLPDDRVAAIWSRFKRPVLVVPSGSDEHVPDDVDFGSLIQRWKAAAPAGTISDLSALIPGANHTVKQLEAREWLAERVVNFLRGLA